MASHLIEIESNQGESLSPILLALLEEYPTLPGDATEWKVETKPGKKVSSGREHVLKLRLVLTIDDPNSLKYRMLERVIEVIQSFGIGTVHIEKYVAETLPK